MKRIFFVLCALIVSITAIYHFAPATGHTATVIPVDGMGFGITWLFAISLLLGVVYWRLLAKAR